MIKLTPAQTKHINDLMKRTIKIDLQKELTSLVKYFQIEDVKGSVKHLFTEIITEFNRNQITIELVAKTVEKFTNELNEMDLIDELHEMYLNNELV